MAILRFGKLDSGRDIRMRFFQRLVWVGIAMAALIFFKAPMAIGSIAFAALVVLGGGALADTYRLKRNKRS